MSRYFFGFCIQNQTTNAHSSFQRRFLSRSIIKTGFEPSTQWIPLTTRTGRMGHRVTLLNRIRLQEDELTPLRPAHPRVD